VVINWTCEPARVESTVQRVFQEVEAIRATPISPDMQGRVRAYLERELERSSEDNAYFLRQIVQRVENGESIANGILAEETAEIERLTGDVLPAAARRYFDPSRYVRVTLMPEARP
jgi:hypothetical protein